MHYEDAKVAIVTVTYNAESFIQAYLNSVEAAVGFRKNFKVILVDNDSQDQTCAIINRFIADQAASATFELVSLKTNVGFGRGCNEGARQAASFKPDLLWFLNPDTIIEEDAANGLLATFESKPDASFVGSSLKDESGVVRSGAFRFPTVATTLLSASMLGVLAKLVPGRVSTITFNSGVVEAEWLSGASFMVKREVFDELDGFDEAYFLYYEEVDLFYRASKANFRAFSTADSVVYHASGASTGINKRTNSDRPTRKPSYWFESRRHFYMKNFGRLYFAVVDIAFVLGTFLKWMKLKANRQPFLEPKNIIADILRFSLLGGKR